MREDTSSETGSAKSQAASPEIRSVIEAIPVALYLCDASGLLTYVNDAAAHLLGYSPRIGDPVDRWAGSSPLRSIADGSPIAQGDSAPARAARLDQPQREELILQRPDGSAITVLMESCPVHGDSHQVTGAATVLTDITQRRLAEITEARLGAIVASSDDAIIGKTLAGMIVSWNQGAERIFGFTAAEAVGNPITIIIPLDLRDEERDILSRLSRGERIEHYETIRRTKSGEQLNVSLTSSPIRDSSGRIVGASKIARDITARKRSEEQLRALHDELRQADQAKNDFLTTLAHELRNPLAPIRAWIYSLQRSESPDQELPHALSVMERQVGQMTRLVDDLIDISRISKNKFALRREPASLRTAIEIAIESSTPLFAEMEQEFTADLPADSLVLYADPARLTQAIGNVLSNAAKYTPHGGQIALRAWQEGENAVITISDNGIGIPAATIDRIFEMFVQLDPSINRSYSGLGVGLHLASRLIEMHGGTLTAASDGAGKGSTFRFTIPLTPVPADSPVVPDPPVHADAVRHRRVLVVDDNHDAADSLGTLLELFGFTTLPVYDGKSALQAGPQFAPDVILLDIGLPGMDGYETARRIRAEPWGERVILCALTGWGQEDARRQSRDAGFDAHLVKPIDADALVAVLDQMPARPAG